MTIAFGEVVPALEKGVADCGITGTMPGYKAKWGEVVDTLFRLPVGYTIGIWAVNLNTWNKLSQPTKDVDSGAGEEARGQVVAGDRGRDGGGRRLQHRRHVLGRPAGQAETRACRQQKTSRRATRR